VEDFCRRYEIGELGGEGQGILCDALLSINDWMLKNGHTTQLYFVVRDAATIYIYIYIYTYIIYIYIYIYILYIYI
jgi:hypothetical protein